MSEVFCCEVARAEGAALAGTATRATAWLLVEHRGPWGPRAVEDNDLPPPVREWLAAQLAALGDARALLVRRESLGATGIRCYLALATEARRELYRFEVPAVSELAGLDPAGLLAAGRLCPHRSDERLTLVCTNGRRDRCCARQGVPTYRALAPLLGDAVWQSTHQGGHRYAATGLWLPEGVAYGFLTPADAPALAAARRRGIVLRSRFRGRTFHPPPVQAADALLRDALGVDALDAWHLVCAEEEPAGRWRVRFAAPGRHFVATLERRRPPALVSCSPPKTKPIDELHLVEWQEESR
jgi:hypothetical protein